MENQPNDHLLNYNKLLASVCLKKNSVVTYNHPQSPQYCQKLPLNQVISANKNGGISGWIDHKNHTGFVYTDLFKKLMNNSGYSTLANKYPDGESPFGIYDMSGNIREWTCSQIIATNDAEKRQSVHTIKGGSWYANLNSCKISMSSEGRRPNVGYSAVALRIVGEKNN